jgi:ElaA protein
LIPVFALKKFEELKRKEIHDIYALRAAIFVVEQDCVYQDIDGKDLEAHHVLGTFESKLIAYARILEKGASYADYVSIGRIAVLEDYRSKSIGHETVRFCLDRIRDLYLGEMIKISAQAHLENFYNQHGFKKEGHPYLEDGIPHIAMIKRSN